MEEAIYCCLSLYSISFNQPKIEHQSHPVIPHNCLTGSSWQLFLMSERALQFHRPKLDIRLSHHCLATTLLAGLCRGLDLCRLLCHRYRPQPYRTLALNNIVALHCLQTLAMGAACHSSERVSKEGCQALALWHTSRRLKSLEGSVLTESFAGLAPEASRFFYFMLMLFAIHTM